MVTLDWTSIATTPIASGVVAGERQGLHRWAGLFAAWLGLRGFGDVVPRRALCSPRGWALAMYVLVAGPSTESSAICHAVPAVPRACSPRRCVALEHAFCNLPISRTTETTDP